MTVGALSRPRGRFGLVLRHRTVIAGAIMLAAVLGVTIIGSAVYPGDPITTHPLTILQGPSADYPLGTDQLGRDVLARVLHAGLLSIPLGMLAITGGAIVGSTIGLFAGLLGGVTDTVISRIVDVLLSFPGLLIALLVVAILGPDSTSAVLAVSITATPSHARVARSTVLNLRSASYVEAARVSNTRTPAMLWRHILPNVRDALLPIFVIGMGNGIIVLAALSFLGIGVQPPAADWGVMLTDGVRSIRTAPLVALAPAVMMYATVLGINLLGEGLGEVLSRFRRTSNPDAE